MNARVRNRRLIVIIVLVLAMVMLTQRQEMADFLSPGASAGTAAVLVDVPGTPGGMSAGFSGPVFPPFGVGGGAGDQGLAQGQGPCQGNGICQGEEVLALRFI